MPSRALSRGEAKSGHSSDSDRLVTIIVDGHKLEFRPSQLLSQRPASGRAIAVRSPGDGSIRFLKIAEASAPALGRRKNKAQKRIPGIDAVNRRFKYNGVVRVAGSRARSE